MDPRTAQALQALDDAARQVASEPTPELTPQYLARIAAVMARPENQEGAEKGHVWRVYEYCIRHFQGARLES
jgi:hypothetical protein